MRAFGVSVGLIQVMSMDLVLPKFLDMLGCASGGSTGVCGSEASEARAGDRGLGVGAWHPFPNARETLRGACLVAGMRQLLWWFEVGGFLLIAGEWAPAGALLGESQS